MNENTLTLLGLPKDADAEAIESAVTALNKRATEAETKLTAIEADTFAKEHADRFEGGEDAAKKLFVENRELAEGIVANARKIVAAPAPADPEDEAAKPKVLNRADTSTPDTSKITATPEAADAKRAVAVRNRAQELCDLHGLPWAQAWDRADREYANRKQG